MEALLGFKREIKHLDGRMIEIERDKVTEPGQNHEVQHTATHCNTVQHSATHCNTLQHTATLCHALQHTFWMGT